MGVHSFFCQGAEAEWHSKNMGVLKTCFKHFYVKVNIFSKKATVNKQAVRPRGLLLNKAYYSLCFYILQNEELARNNFLSNPLL